MGSADKDRILKTAERLVLRGKFASAVAEYLKLVKSGPDDVILLNTVGDLLVRLNKHPEAVNYFNRVADLYLNQGFTLKAMATLKKILKLTPDNSRVQELLANLYYRQGFYHDACLYYKVIGERLLQGGKEHEAGEIFRKIVEFEKSNIEVLERLGDLEAGRGDKQAAANYMKLAGAASLKQHKGEQALSLLMRAMDLNPRDVELVGLIVTAAHATGQDPVAKGVLDNLLALHPQDVHLRELRARSLLYLGQLREAEALLLDLQRLGGQAGALLELLSCYLERRDPEGFHRLAEELVERLTSPEDSRRLGEMLQRATAQMPENTSLQQTLCRLHVSRNDLAAAAVVQSELISHYVLRGDLRKAFVAVDQLVQWEPSNAEFRRQHRALFEKVYPGKAYEEPVSQPGEIQGSELDEISLTDLEQIQLAGSSAEFKDTSPEVQGVSIFKITPEDLSPEILPGGWETPPPDFASSQTLQEVSDVEAERSRNDGREGIPDVFDIVPSSAENVPESVQEVDFYLKMGFRNEARRLLERLRERYPDDERVQKRWREVERSTESDALSCSAVDSIPISEQEQKDLSLQIDDAIDSLFEFDFNNSVATAEGAVEYKEGLAQNVVCNPSRSQDFQIHLDLGAAYRDMGLLQDAIQEFQQASGWIENGVQSDDTTLCYTLLADCHLELNEPEKAIYWARKGLELPETKNYEKRALLYDLGRALEAQGNNQEALRFYSKVYEVTPDFRDTAERVARLRN
ncbi:MAG: tetratricopeptide repeat protein [Acidobacteria bacterium]|nr:tetratricopeptide repeat protein [Acidobacteriota bacterium]